MAIFFRFILLSALIFIGLMTAPVQAQSPAISDIRIGNFESKTRFVIDISQKTDYRIFHLKAPNRIVIDLPKSTWQAGKKISDPTKIIKTYRHGIFEQATSRIVLDLNRPAIVDNAFLLTPDFDRPYRLIIDLKATSSPTFHASLKKVWGSTTAPKILAKKQASQQKVVQPQAITPPTKPKTKMVYQEQKAYKKHIVIDAGHGGPDPGAIAANGMYEKVVTLAAAKELKRQLEATGRYEVSLTRDRDIYHKLRKRIQIARNLKADIFISLHADSLNRRNVKGASVYTLSDKASDKETARLAARENNADAIIDMDLSTEDDDVADILIDLAMRDTMNHSKVFADTLVKALGQKGITLLENTHRFAGFAVLKAPDIPSVLVEMGYLSNAKEAQKLASSDYRKRLMSAIVFGIDLYFDNTAETAGIF